MYVITQYRRGVPRLYNGRHGGWGGTDGGIRTSLVIAGFDPQSPIQVMDLVHRRLL
jgi:hypothetical protein